MFFDQDSSSGVSGDLESATTVASFMEGFWGMGNTVSSYSTAKRLEVGSPGGGAGGRLKKGQDTEGQARHALADRIEGNLEALLGRTDEILRDNRNDVLALAHALERYKTLSGEDVVAVLEHQRGPLVDGTPYADQAFVAELNTYHNAAARAHREHSMEQLSLPVPAAAAPPWTVAVIADPDAHGPNGSNPDQPL
jgi:cell division protease FtsH